MISAPERPSSASVHPAPPPLTSADLLKHTRHDWGDRACLAILGRIRHAMAPCAPASVVEAVAP